MQDIMNEHVAVRAEIVRTVRAPVATQRAYPVCPSVHRCTSPSVGRI